MTDPHQIASTIELMLDQLGLDWREVAHMQGTPLRVAKMMIDLTTPMEFEFTMFQNEDIDHMIVVQGIPFHSLCAHHLLPFFGVAHVAYVPDKRLAGLSKFARTIKHFSRGANVQEEMTQDVANFLEEKLDPKGLGVVLRGRHLCMEMRGAEAHGETVTSSMKGVFLDPKKGARSEFLNLLGGSSG